jgi:hypothetical protein
MRWQRAGFKLYWRWKSRLRCSRPTMPLEIRRPIRQMSIANRTRHRPIERRSLEFLPMFGDALEEVGSRDPGRVNISMPCLAHTSSTSSIAARFPSSEKSMTTSTGADRAGRDRAEDQLPSMMGRGISGQLSVVSNTQFRLLRTPTDR